MKKAFVIGIVLFVTLSLLSSCALFRNTAPGSSPTATGQSETPLPSETPEQEPSQTPDAFTGIGDIKTERYDYKSDYIEVSIKVPQLTGFKDGAVEDSINEIFSGIMTNARADVKPMEAESKQLVENGQTAASYMIDISYSVPYNYNGILSVVVSDYRYLGGAHGGDIRSAYTLDLGTGRQLALGDLMEPESDYRDFINSAIRAEIDRGVQGGQLYELVPFEDIGDNPAFYLTENAVVFYFQEYEYFPYAAGIQEFPIKYSDLSGMLKTEYAALTIEPVILKEEAGSALSIGDIGQVALSGNPTTGYAWHYTISDTSIVQLSSEQYMSASDGDADGSGWAYIWYFRGLKAGTATITFKYYRDWEGEADAAPEDIIEYTVTVK